MARSSAIRTLAAAALLAWVAPAHAAVLTFEFEGVVTTLTRDGGLFGAPGTVEIGDPFTGRFSYETGPGNPDQLPADPEIGFYVLQELVVDQAVIPFASLLGVSVRHEPGGLTLPPTPPDPGRDWFGATATSAVYPTVSVLLRAPFGAAFADDALPLSLDLADFPDAVVLRGLVAVGLAPNPSIEDVGTLTALQLAPEPDAFALALAAVASLAVRGRRRANR